MARHLLSWAPGMNFTVRPQGFEAESGAQIARRVPQALAAFVAVMGAAWFFEHRGHPGRDLAFAVLYFAESASLALAALLLRFERFRPYAVGITSVAACLVAVFMGAYHVWTDGEADTLALGLSFLAVACSAFLPWGVRGQLPLAATTLGVYVGAVALRPSITADVSAEISFLGLGCIGALSVGAAYLFDRYRLDLFRRTRELEEANRALREANEAKNRLLAAVSHELRTPLSAILGYADLLLDGTIEEVGEGTRMAVDRIARNARQLLGVITDLVDLSRAEGGQLEISTDTVPLDVVFEDMRGLAEPLFRERPIRFECPDPGPLTVRADPQRLRQVLTNLLTNASKYTAEGEVLLEAVPQPNGTVAVRVRDTGTGIPPEDLPLIFRPFRRSKIHEQISGAGLGLALARELVERMGGRIEVESTLGKGTTFTVHLPSGG